MILSVSAESTLLTASDTRFNEEDNTAASLAFVSLAVGNVNLPASDVVQEGQLGVHQAGKEGHLPVRQACE